MMDGEAYAMLAENRAAERRSRRAIDLQNFIPSTMVYVAQRILSTASAAYRPRFGVGITEWRVMAMLAAEPWTAPVQICASTGLDKAAVSRSLKELAASGIVETRGIEGRERRLPVALTMKGLAIHDEIVEASLIRQEDLLAEFSANDRETLRDFIARIRRAVDREVPVAATPH